MVVEKLPPWLQAHCTALESRGLFSTPINHVLINEYLPGQGIMAHVDGPLFTPLITTLNLGSSCIIRFSNQDNDKEFSLFLEKGSLLVQTGEVYESWLHRIDEVKQDVIDETVVNLGLCQRKLEIGDVVERVTRVSLTIRNVPKVCKFKMRL
eukprot:sb/3473442/